MEKVSVQLVKLRQLITIRMSFLVFQSKEDEIRMFHFQHMLMNKLHHSVYRKAHRLFQNERTVWPEFAAFRIPVHEERKK